MFYESYITMVANSSLSVLTIRVRFLKRLSRSERTECRVESRLISSGRYSVPTIMGIVWFGGTRSHRESMEKLRGIKRKAGLGLLQAVHQGFEQLSHGLKGIGIE